jgi:hypothetical protein
MGKLMAGALGRIPPSDDEHIQKYSLTSGTMPTEPTAVVIGINWYQAFDFPSERGAAFWLPSSGEKWGGIRGGHAICLRPPAIEDNLSWWKFYNQQAEGACVGFSGSRAMTLDNRTRYDGFELFYEARLRDEWPGENYDGTSVRAGMDVLRDKGAFLYREKRWDYSQGIAANRWARNVEEIAACLDPASGGKKVLRQGYVILLNSWGTVYPHYVRMPLDTLDRLIFREDGDATVITDR